MNHEDQEEQEAIARFQKFRESLQPDKLPALLIGQAENLTVTELLARTLVSLWMLGNDDFVVVKPPSLQNVVGDVRTIVTKLGIDREPIEDKSNKLIGYLLQYGYLKRKEKPTPCPNPS